MQLQLIQFVISHKSEQLTFEFNIINDFFIELKRIIINKLCKFIKNNNHDKRC